MGGGALSRFRELRQQFVAEMARPTLQPRAAHAAGRVDQNCPRRGQQGDQNTGQRRTRGLRSRVALVEPGVAENEERYRQGAIATNPLRDTKRAPREVNATIIRLEGVGLVLPEKPKFAAGRRVAALRRTPADATTPTGRPTAHAAREDPRARQGQNGPPSTGDGLVFLSPKWGACAESIITKVGPSIRTEVGAST